MTSAVLPSALAPAGAGDSGEVSERVQAAFDAEVLAAVRMSAWIRLGVLVVIGLWLSFLIGTAVVYYLGLLILFAAIGFVQYHLYRKGFDRPWVSLGFLILDFGLLAFATLAPNPLLDSDWPSQMILRQGNIIYFFVILVGFTASYSPRATLAAGLVAAMAWMAGVALHASAPGTVTSLDITDPRLSLESLMIELDPHYIDIDVAIQDVIGLLLVAAILAASVARSRHLVLRQALAERARGNLSRYFPPNIVEQLSATDRPLETVRAQPVAVLFADVVGFTRLAQDLAPEAIIALLRALHGRLEAAVFAHGGTLDKFLGDGIMATFGTPRGGPRDAGNAIACARAAMAAIEVWNQERQARGEAPIRLSIGVHYGNVVLGDIGSERRLEFAVLGDPVNVASRLEQMTRELGARIVLSDALVEAALAEDRAAAEGLIEGFERQAPQPLRGHAESVMVWIDR